MKGKPLISFYDKVTHLVDKGMVVDVIFLNFSKVFESIPYSIFLGKLPNCEVNKYMLHCVMNWLNNLGAGVEWIFSKFSDLNPY